MQKTKEERNKYFREYRKRNLEKMREYNKNYNRIWRKKNGYETERKSQKKFPDKLYAGNIVRKLVHQGKLIRGNCEVCFKPKAQGHHPNYCKPLDIRWLCPEHHRQVHSHCGDSE